MKKRAFGLGFILGLGVIAALLAVAAMGQGGAMIEDATTPEGSASASALPCSGERAHLEECALRNVSRMDPFNSRPNGGGALGGEPSGTVEEVLAKGLRLASASPVHIVFRGTAASTVQCEWRGIARTAQQREGAVRFWLDLGTDESTPDAKYLEALFNATLSAAAPAYLETAKANFTSMIEGGLSEEYRFLTCFATYEVPEYILGAGPSTLKVAYDRMGEAHGYDLYRVEHEAGVLGGGQLMSAGEYQGHLDSLAREAEAVLREMVGGREGVVFLAPMGAHNAIAFEAWQAIDQWDLQRDDAGVVQAVRYGAPAGDPEYTQTLANLKARIVAATTSGGASGRSANTAPARIPNVSGLTQYYRNIGAYGDITPGDGSTATFTPAQPPAAYSCASGTAVTSPNTNGDLVRDCEVLVDRMDALRGTGTLNWSASLAMGNWTGVTTAGVPARVTKIELPNKSLTGGIPGGLGRLLALTHLDLSGNSLTGDIPAELGWLHNLQSLKLSGNSLTGCVPLALRSVATNDLSSLNLPACNPPAPGAPAAGTVGETGVPLTWPVAANATKYRVEYRDSVPGYWTVADDAITGTSFMVDGLRCGTAHQFRLSAYGDGTTYGAAWGDPSAAVTATTTACVTPVFGKETYAFTIAENAAAGTAVGTVSATDPNGDTVAYSITAGNDDDLFAINGSTGAVTVAGILDFETTASHAITVQASDGTNAATVTAEVVVMDANDAPVFAQDSYSFSVAESTPAWTTVGTVSATDQDAGDTFGVNVYYYITAGNVGERFIIAGNGGDILVWQALDYETTPSYTLTVEARDDKGGVGTATVEITVTNVPEGRPAAPSDLAASLADDSFTLSWGAVEGAAKYEASHTTDAADAETVTWSALPETTATSTTYSPTGGPTCATTYQFRVRAYGDGEIHLAEWGIPSPAVSYTTEACNRSPTFGSSSYSFTVSEDAAMDAAVGTVAATDPDTGDTLTYSITAGNGEGAFSINGSTGAISVAAALDYETTEAYALTVEAADGRGGTATVPVAVGVTDVAENGPPLPARITWAYKSVAGTFGASWTAVDGADLYRMRYRTGSAASDWTNLEAVTGTSYTFAPEGGPDCGTTYELSLQSHGDGVTYDAIWGTHSNSIIYTTAACRPPVFSAASYSFTVAEDAAVGAAVGTVSATAPEGGDTMSYAITAGNDAGKFAIGGSTGSITVAAALDYETTTTYSLTVQATDGRGSVGTATVKIIVGNVAESRPPAPQNLTATAAVGGVTLSWDAPDDSTVTGYQILRRRPGSGETVLLVHVADTGSTATTYTDTDVTPGTRYVYRVRAINAKGTGPYSNSASATTPRGS